MPIRIVSGAVLWVFLCLSVVAATPPAAEEAIAVVLDQFHRAASEADGETYFGLFADGAIFIGTDPVERWTIDEFKAFAEPYFSSGRGWIYVPGDRHVTILEGGNVALFDEVLSNESYGKCRGTGVLVLTVEGWRIAQYSLSIPIPNEITGEVVRRIKEFEESPGSAEATPSETSTP